MCQAFTVDHQACAYSVTQVQAQTHVLQTGRDLSRLTNSACFLLCHPQVSEQHGTQDFTGAHGITDTGQARCAGYHRRTSQQMRRGHHRRTG